MTSRSFDASWSTAVGVISTLVSVFLVALVAFLAYQMLSTPAPEARALAIVIAVPLSVLGGCLLFTVRGYRVDRTSLRIQRLLWETTIPLNGLRRVWADPEAMRRSWRLFGNGGLFSISGLFRNKTLGSYRAFATDPKNAVVLETADRRIVVTPDSPRSFVDTVVRIYALA